MTTVIDEMTFRQVLSRWPSGVGIVTTAGREGWHGMTASSFSSVSLTPPLVLVCLDRRIRSHDLLIRNGVFAVNVLGREHLELGRRFAGMEAGVQDRFAAGDWLPGATGSPVLTDAAAWVDCRVRHRYPGGDHSIFLGEVAAAGVPRLTSPLLFHSRSWGQLADPLPERVGISDSVVAEAAGRAGATDPRAARLTDALRQSGIRVRLPLVHGTVNGVGDHNGHAGKGSSAGSATRSVHVPDAAGALAAARAGHRTVELTVAADGLGRAAAEAADALSAAGRDGTALVVRVREALHPALARAALETVRRLATVRCAEIVLEEPPEAPPEEGGSPLALRRLLQDAVPEAAGIPLRLSLRDQHGLGLVNALTAMKSGVSLFDTALGGHGGLLATEQLALLCSRVGVEAPLDVAALRALAADLAALHRRPAPPAPDLAPPSPAPASRAPETL